MDWYLPDFKIYVEYFGLYQKSQLERNTRLGRYSRKVNKKISYCEKNGIHLLAIFKEDLENMNQGLINKFREMDIKI